MKTFSKKLQAKKQQLGIYFTAGYPNVSDMNVIIETLDRSTVDFIEIGMPYSDPLADGLIIQKSSKKALENGMNLDLMFEQLLQLKSIDTPLILMGYFNQVLQYGVEDFLKISQKARITGMIIPDLPLEVYQSSYQSLFQKFGITISMLITPNTPLNRIEKIDKVCDGFIYIVSSTSTTGSKLKINKSLENYYHTIEKMGLKNPRMIGFGISDKNGFVQACRYAHGAIIGSAFIQHLDENDIENSVINFIQKICN